VFQTEFVTIFLCIGEMRNVGDIFLKKYNFEKTEGSNAYLRGSLITYYSDCILVRWWFFFFFYETN